MAIRWRYSPWIGTYHCGWAIDRYVFSSSAWAWPVACTSRVPEWTTWAPARSRPSITRLTFDSLPGMAWLDRITVSFSVSLTNLFSPRASSASADIGSPCDPVEMTHTSPGG